MNNLKILPTNKTVVFYCPFEGNNCLVRTGTIDDIPIISFLNAILYSYSKSFKDMNSEDRLKMINKVKNIIFDKINKNLWDTDGLIIFKNLFKESVIDFYNFINTNQTVKNTIVKKVGRKLVTTRKEFELFKIITELVPVDIFITGEDEFTSVDSYKKYIISTIKLYLQNLSILSEINEEKVEHIINSISKFILILINEVEFNSFKNYTYNSVNINNIIVDTVMNYFNYNIYFINSYTRTPYIMNDFNTFTNINSIILLSIDDKHFEAVGKLTHGNNVIREYVSTDPIIFKINSIININEKTKKIDEVIRVVEVVTEKEEKTIEVINKYIFKEVNDDVEDISEEVNNHEEDISSKVNNDVEDISEEVNNHEEDVYEEVNKYEDEIKDDLHPFL